MSKSPGRPPGTTRTRMQLRLPQPLYEEVSALSETQAVSINELIVRFVAQGLRGGDGGSPDPGSGVGETFSGVFAQRLALLESRVAQVEAQLAAATKSKKPSS